MSKADKNADNDAVSNDITPDIDDVDGESTTELRPTGKRARRSGGTTALLEPETDADTDGDGAKKTKKQRRPASESRNPFARIWLFLTQVVAEMRKVIWPTRRQIVIYSIVVVVFVVIMSAFVAGLDLGFNELVKWAFG